MSQNTCACSQCNCSIGSDYVEKDGKKYCCQACASGHATGSPCSHPGCKCGAK
ncbi:metallothionein [Pseudomonas sp. RIT-PI-AD]|uniref:metallothionein n=1 Tax=Pseudomonas sp. RIT-PI-AD TaxID=3035294 RepID=UPI0021D9EA39|nr:metallothionein [Pseudomonas sp. RIT-PI-AD]